MVDVFFVVLGALGGLGIYVFGYARGYDSGLEEGVRLGERISDWLEQDDVEDEE